MEKLKIKMFLLVWLISYNICCHAQQEKFDPMNIEKIKINKLSVFSNTHSWNNGTFYEYVNIKTIKGLLGEPDRIVERIDELNETKYFRLTIGKSYLDFYNPVFREGDDQNEFTLHRIHVKDPEIILSYEDKVIKVGCECPFYYLNPENKSKVKVSVPLRKGLLDKGSDYAFWLEYEEGRVVSWYTAFD